MRLFKLMTLSSVVALLLMVQGCEKFGKGGASGDHELAYEIDGKKVTVADIQKNNPGAFYELEKRKAEMISELANTAYVDGFFADLGKKSGKSKEEAQKEYLAKNVQVSDQEVAATLERLGSHPNLASMTPEQKTKTIKDYLTNTKSGQVIRGVIDTAVKEKKLVVSFKVPEEPRYNLTVAKDEVVRYGPAAEDIKPMGCEGDACKVTIVEYSEFQCPFCSKIMPISKQVFEKYKGKVRWIVRNFPLDFHPMARPAALAALCAHEQGKYWQLYQLFFDNQKDLSEAKLVELVQTAGLDKAKYDACMAKTADLNKVIDEQMRIAQQLGVQGTPAFFVNGRKISGALPYENFEKMIEEELAGKK